MGSMNWLGFSLSPQELPSQGSNHGECYDLGSHSTVPSSFDIFEAFHRSNDNQSQDWNNMKGSMLMGNQESDEQPKLENFLGSSHSFRDNNNNINININNNQNNENYMFNSIPNPNNNNSNNNNINNNNNNSNNNNGINVSMIKTWLRSNQQSQQEMVIMNKSNNIHNGGGTTGSESLSLSMGTGTHSGAAALPLLAAGGGVGGNGGGDVESSVSENSSSKQQSDSVISNNNTITNNNVTNNNNNKNVTNNNVDVQSGAIVEVVPRKSIETFGQRTSIYRGVTRHRWTGRYEAHLWDNSCRREGQTRKGRQVYLGGYDKEEKAARAYDLAAIKYWGTTTTTNFPISDYEKEIEDMKHMTRQEYVASLRRKSSGFSRGASIYRGVTRHHQHGRWQARIGRVAGNKDLYLGTFSTQEEAAEAYDIAAIKFRGLNAVTNFEINRYDVKTILESTNLPIGGAAKRLKEAEQLNAHDLLRAAAVSAQTEHHQNNQFLADPAGTHNFYSWPGLAYQQTQTQEPLTLQYSYANVGHQQPQQQKVWCKQEQETTNVSSTNFHDFHQSAGHFYQMHNLMGLDDTTNNNNTSNSDIYGLPYPAAVQVTDGNTYDNYYSYLSNPTNHNSGVRGAVGTYDQGTACTNWASTAIPTLASSRTVDMGAAGGAVPTFTVWNDT